MCDALIERRQRAGQEPHCSTPATYSLLVEISGEVLHLCNRHAEEYDNGIAIRYTPRGREV